MVLGRGAPLGPGEPKGVVTAALLPAGAKIGDVFGQKLSKRSTASTCMQILPSKSSSPLPELIEIKGTKPVEGGVSSDLRRPLRDGDTRGAQAAP